MLRNGNKYEQKQHNDARFKAKVTYLTFTLACAGLKMADLSFIRCSGFQCQGYGYRISEGYQTRF